MFSRLATDVVASELSNKVAAESSIIQSAALDAAVAATVNDAVATEVLDLL